MNGPGAVGELAQATRVGGEGDDFHEDRQAFLGHRRRGRALGQEGADRLVQAVEGGADVHQSFVDFQRPDVALVEHRVGADLDVVGARRRVSDDAVGLEHADGFLGLAEHPVEAVLQQADGFLGAEHLGFVLEVATAVDVVQVIGEHQAQVGQGRIASVEGVGGGAVQFL